MNNQVNFIGRVGQNPTREREIVLRALISHVFKCKDTLNLHNETKDALGDKAINTIAEQAKNEMESALTMVSKYFGVHLPIQSSIVLTAHPVKAKSLTVWTKLLLPGRTNAAPVEMVLIILWRQKSEALFWHSKPF